MSSAETVFVSGATGFIALHVLDLLLTKGYKVIGSVRSAAKGDKLVKDFKEKHPSGDLKYEIVADIGAENAFDKALASHPEIKYVLHTASPFHFNGGDASIDEIYLKPAVEGTLNMLKAIKANAPQVTNVVVTSSFAAVMDMTQPSSFVHTEKTWNPITLDQTRENPINGYIGSKKFAEKAAWDFFEAEKPNFRLTTVNPGYVFGPQLFMDADAAKQGLNTSSEIVNGALKSTPESADVSKLPAGIAVDVRDVAKLHLAGIEREEAFGERLLALSGKFDANTLLVWLSEAFPQLEGKIAKGDAQKGKEACDAQSGFDVSHTLKISGVGRYITAQQSVIDSAKQILDLSS